MEVRFALVLDRNAGPGSAQWPASGVAETRAGLRLEHDGHVLLLPRRPGDRRIDDVVAEHRSTGARDPAGVYQLARPGDPVRGNGAPGEVPVPESDDTPGAGAPRSPGAEVRP